MRRPLLALAASLLVAATSRADVNLNTVFPSRTHDFGAVARGSQLRHRFRIVNTTGDELRIAETRAKCGCTEVKLGAKVIPPKAETYVDTVLDTTKFLGPKKSGVTLIIDRPVFTEVDLDLNCFIRGEILLNPGQVEFGVVPRGKPATRTLALTYAGSAAGWGIQKMNTISSAISARLDPPGRTAEGYLQYQLTVTLDSSAPLGYLRDEIELITNDPQSPRIPISVSANVQGAVTVAPGTILLGSIKAGSEVKKTVLVKSAKPFKIVATEAKQGAISGTGASADAKALQQLTVTFKAPEKLGGANAVLKVETDLPDEPPAEVTVFATIVK